MVGRIRRDTSQGVSEFGDEVGPVEAGRADADPPPPDPDVAGFDVALADPGRLSGLPTPWAEVVRLELHGLR